jgi:hypothetical protein
MNLSGLNAKQATASTTTDTVSDFVSPYYTKTIDTDGSLGEEQVDAVARMFYPKRKVSARPITDEVFDTIDEKVLNRFLSATGVENNIPRKAKFASRLFFNFAKKDGDLVTREVPVSIVQASHIFDVVVNDEGNMSVEFITLESYLVRHGFLKKGALGKKSDSSKVAIPLVADLNSMRLSLTGQNYVCKLAATAYIDSGKSDGTSFAVDLRVAETNVKVGDMEKAIEVILKGADTKVRAASLAFVRTAILFALSMGENLRIHKGEQEGFLPRDIYRMFGVQVSEAYYGKAEYSEREDNYRFHALVSGVFDLATLGGAWETVPAGRVVAGDGWSVPCMNTLNR